MSKASPAFTTKKGDNDPITVTATLDSSAFNLTNAVVRFTARDGKYNSTISLEKNSANGNEEIEISNALGGIFIIKILPSDTRVLEDKKYIFDIEITDSEGNIYTADPDWFEVEQDITRP